MSYQVRGKSFVFFRTPRPDALDPHTGERLADVMVIWVDDEVTKLALVGDESGSSRKRVDEGSESAGFEE